MNFHESIAVSGAGAHVNKLKCVGLLIWILLNGGSAGECENPCDHSYNKKEIWTI